MGFARFGGGDARSGDCFTTQSDILGVARSSERNFQRCVRPARREYVQESFSNGHRRGGGDRKRHGLRQRSERGGTASFLVIHCRDVDEFRFDADRKDSSDVENVCVSRTGRRGMRFTGIEAISG